MVGRRRLDRRIGGRGIGSEPAGPRIVGLAIDGPSDGRGNLADVAGAEPLVVAAGAAVKGLGHLAHALSDTEIANAHLAAATTSFAFASDTHYPLQSEDVLAEPLDMSDGLLAVPRSAGLGVELDRVAMDRLANNQVRESVFYDDIQGEAPRVGQIL